MASYTPIGAAVLLSIVFLGIFFIYVLIFGTHSRHRADCIGFLYQFLFVRLPLRISHIFVNRLDNHPLDSNQIRRRCRHLISFFFGVIYFYIVIVYYVRVFPYLDSEFPFPRAMRLISYLVTPWPMILFFVLQFTDPGEITTTNIQSYLALYPPDGYFYCATDIPGTRWPVVPRSHYCRWTNRWIAKFDHYCPWVAQPIGERTLGLFLLFLLSCLAISVVGSAGFLAHCIACAASAEKFSALVDTALASLDCLFSLTGTIGVDIVLVYFIGMLCWQCSHNLTSLEAARKEQWLRENPGHRFVNRYDRGFWQNWRAVASPPVARQHPPYVPLEEE
jgi:hypothetical protein